MATGVTGGNGVTGTTAWNITELYSRVDDGTVQAGDVVYFRRGDIFEGKLFISAKTGITFTSTNSFVNAPGNEEVRPIITGSRGLGPAEDWHLESSSAVGDLYWYFIPNSTPVKHVFLNGQVQTLAREPDLNADPEIDDPELEWLRSDGYVIDLPNTDGTITDAGLPAGDWNGATLVVRNANWQYLQPVGITHVGQTLTFDISGASFENGFEDMGTGDWGYFIKNDRDALDQPGEWYYHSGEQRLYLMVSNGQHPSDMQVRATYHEDSQYGFTMQACSSITISELAFEHQWDVGIHAYGATDELTVQNCTFADQYEGINDYGSTNSAYLDNTFTRAWNAGIETNSSDADISGNTFRDIGLIIGYGKKNTYPAYTGVISLGNRVQIRNNLFEDIGYVGIWLSGNGDPADEMAHIIEGNSIARTLLILNDGGAVFFDNCSHLTIQDNIITDAEGDYQSTAQSYQGARMASGIYFNDKPISSVTVRNNTVSGCGTGINVDHRLDAEPYIVRDNTLFNNGTQIVIQDYSNYRNNSLTVNGDGNGVPHIDLIAANNINYRPLYGDTYEGNILYCLNEDQLCMEQRWIWWPQQDAILTDGTDFGAFNNNHYHNPFTDLPIQVVSAQLSDETEAILTTLPRTFSQWQAIHGEDLNSTQSPLSLVSYTPTGLPGPPLLAHSTDFENNLMDFWEEAGCTTPETGVLGFLPLTTTVLNSSATCEWFQNWQSMTEPGPATLNDLGKYQLSFKIKASEPTTLMTSIIWDVTLDPPGKRIMVDTEVQAMTLFFDIASLAPGDQLTQMFHHSELALGIEPPFAELWLDDVVLQKCEYGPATPLSDHILRYRDPLGDPEDPQNVYDTQGSFELVGCWSDVEGTIYSGTVTLDEDWESIVLYRLEDDYDIDVAVYNVDVNDGTPGDGIEIWTTDMNVRGSVVVGDGKTLTIDGATIGFADSRQDEEVLTNILVQPGGTLNVINGAVLTTIEGCGDNSMWDGTKMLGTTGGGPAGDLIMNGSTISNALTAILCGEGDPMDPGRTGPVFPGRFFVTNSTLENNRYDIVRHGVPDGADDYGINNQHMHIGGNTFRTSAPLHYNGLAAYPDFNPVAHLLLSDMHGVFLANNTFANDIGAHTKSHRMAHGIDALNTNLLFWSPNVFRNLDHAIHSVTTATSIPQFTNINNCTFIDNICAVYAKDLLGVSITDNTIEMARWDLGAGNYTHLVEELWGDNHRAIFSTGSNAFSIMDNTLTRSMGGTAPCEGIVVGYTDAENEVVFRNSASDLDRAFVGEGVCADVDGDPSISGLQQQCNTNVNNDVNFTSRPANGATPTQQLDHTIRGRQGTPTFSASNTFDGGQHYEIATRADALEYVEYSYGAGQAPATYTVQNPNDLDADYMVPVLVTTAIACGTGEPVWIAGGGNTHAVARQALTAAKLEYGNLRYQYEQLIDGGSTDQVVEQIVETWPQAVWELRDSLLAKSPFLSTAALMELVNKQVPEALKAEILIANPDATKKDAFLKWAEVEADYPIPGYLAEAIEASWSEHTYRTVLEENLADKHTRYTQLTYHALKLLQTDSLAPHPDSLRWVWKQLRTPGARYAESALLLGQGNYAAADSVLDEIGELRELSLREQHMRERMRAYVGVLANANGDGRNAYQLSSIEVDSLEALVGTHYDRPANWASNLLCAVYNRCRPPYTGDANAPKSDRSRQRIVQQPATASGAFGVQPNPARNAVALRYDFGTLAGTAIAQIRDAAGRIIATIPLDGLQGQQNCDVSGVAPGAYVIQYFSGEQVLGNVPFVIQR